jgi:hypothetical protein
VPVGSMQDDDACNSRRWCKRSIAVLERRWFVVVSQSVAAVRVRVFVVFVQRHDSTQAESGCRLQEALNCVWI